MKLVVNKDYGGFSISPRAIVAIAKRQGKKVWFWKQEYAANGKEWIEVKFTNKLKRAVTLFAFDTDESPEDKDNNWWKKHYLTNGPDDRTDKDLIAVVEQLGKEADGDYASLKIIEIPDGIEYTIDDYDGYETVHEQHRSW